jgi:hypothetical protein
MNASRAARTASAQRGSHDQQAVGEWIEQRAEAAVLAGDARRHPVEVVAPGNERE